MEILPDEIHLWFAHDDEITNHRLRDRYLTILSQDERRRYKQFLFDEHRHQYLITRALLRCVLSFYDNSILPGDWKFQRNKYGKPSIHQGQSNIPLHFNLSHSKTIIVLAISLRYEIGVDIEYIDRVKAPMDIAERNFHHAELKALYALEGEKQRERFFELWTLKEAYSKAVGKGLSIPLNSVSFTFPRQNSMAVSCDNMDKQTSSFYYFWLVHLNNSHKLSIVLSGTAERLSYNIKTKKIIPMQNFTSMKLPELVALHCKI